MEGLELEPGMRSDVPSVQWPLLPYQGRGLIPSCWNRSQEGRPELALFSLSVFFPPPAPLPWSGKVLKQVRPVRALGLCWPWTKVQAVSHALPVGAPTAVFPCSVQMYARVQVPFVPRS